LSSSGQSNQYILTNLSAFSAPKLFLMLDHITEYMLKKYTL